jgi:hypothetical protein
VPVIFTLYRTSVMVRRPRAPDAITKKPVGEQVSVRAVASQNLHFSGGSAEVLEPESPAKVKQLIGEGFHFSGGSGEALEQRNSQKVAQLEWEHKRQERKVSISQGASR